MTRNALVVIYLAGAAAAVISLNANSGDGELAIAIWAVASAAFCAFISTCLIFASALIKNAVDARRGQQAR